MSTDVRQHLEDLENDWEDEEVTEGGGDFFKLPDGSYDVKIVETEVGLSQKDNLQIVYTLKIVDGEYKNKEVKKFASLQSGRLGWAKGDLNKIGVKIPERLKDLPEVLDSDVTDLLVVIDVKNTKGKDGIEYNNIYFAKSLSNSNGSKDSSEAKAQKISSSKNGKKAIFKEGRKKYTGTVISEENEDGDVEFEVDEIEEIWDVPLNELKFVKEEVEEKTAKRRRSK